MALPVTKNFNAANQNLTAYDANFTYYAGGHVLNLLSNALVSGGAGSNYAIWTGDTFADDQYAKCVASAIVNADSYVGLNVRTTAGGGYISFFWRSDATLLQNTGAAINVTTIAVPTQGNTVELRVTGTTINVLFNDVSQGTWENTSGPSSGSAGIAASGGGAQNSIDDWEAGNVGGSTAKPHLYYANQSIL